MATSKPPTNDPKLPSFECESYRERLEQWRTMMDCWRGRLNKVDDPELYLPKEENEPRDAYPKRLARSPYENHLKKTISGYAGSIAGMAFDGDLPPAIEAIQDDIDMKGHSFATFTDSIDVKSIRDVYCFVLIDYHRPEVVNRKEELQSPPRPFARVLDPRQVPNWDEHCGKLKRVTIKECHEKNYAYGSTEEDVYRVIEGDKWRVVRLVESGQVDRNGKKIWEEQLLIEESEDGQIKRHEGQYLGANGHPLGYCPIVPYVLTADCWTGDDLPEFIGLADLNIALYQSVSDWRAIVRSLCPVPWVTGDTSAKLTNEQGNLSLGPHDFLHLGNAPNAAAGYLQANPSAVQPAYDAVIDLRAQIKEMGINSLGSSGHQRTATEIRMSFNDAQKMIDRFAAQKESAINNILAVMADYIGIDKTALPKASVASDISALLTDVPTLVQLYKENLLSLESAVKRLHQLGFNSDATDELLRLEEADKASLGIIADKMNAANYPA